MRVLVLNFGAARPCRSTKITRQITFRNASGCIVSVGRGRAQVMVEANGSGGKVIREVLTRPERAKLDEEDDRDFYDAPRLVKHVDDDFLAQVTALYRQRLPPGGVILDLMSSWVSHLPPEVSYSRVVGHGLNAAELSRNKQLTEFFVRNLNKDPDGWAFPDKTFDAVLICVSIQYLQFPERVFSEIYRVLKPGGICIVTFSNRQFYSKAIQAWRDNTGFGRVQLVKQYFLAVAGFTQPQAVTQVETTEPTPPRFPAFLAPLQNFFQRSQSDPFYAVMACRNYWPALDS